MEQEAELIERAKIQPEAFGQLFDMYYQPIFSFLLSRTGSVELAQDLTSETFFQALKSLPRYTYRGKPFKSWLYAIAVAQIGNYYRGRSKYLSVTTDECPELVARETYEADYDMIEAEQGHELKWKISLLKKVMKQLNQKQQTILDLRFRAKLSIPEIAATIGMKEGTIKSHIHRAVKKLHVLMQEEMQTKPYETAVKTSTRDLARAIGNI